MYRRSHNSCCGGALVSVVSFSGVDSKVIGSLGKGLPPPRKVPSS